MSAAIIPFNHDDQRCLRHLSATVGPDGGVQDCGADKGLSPLFEICEIITNIQDTMEKQEQSAADGRRINLDHLGRAVRVLTYSLEQLQQDVNRLRMV